jgi:hypothetical protein
MSKLFEFAIETYLQVALLVIVSVRERGSDEDGVDDGSDAQLEAMVLQVVVYLLEQPTTELVLLQ